MILIFGSQHYRYWLSSVHLHCPVLNLKPHSWRKNSTTAGAYPSWHWVERRVLSGQFLNETSGFSNKIYCFKRLKLWLNGISLAGPTHEMLMLIQFLYFFAGKPQDHVSFHFIREAGLFGVCFSWIQSILCHSYFRAQLFMRFLIHKMKK